VILGKIRKALGEVSLNRYPDPFSRGLRSAFAQRFNCPREKVMAGNGSDELIGLLVWTLRRGRAGGSPVMITPTPTFAMYSILSSAAGYDVHEVPLGPGLEPDIDAMLRVIGEKKPNIVFLSNPNNPTGTFYSREQIQAILKTTTGLVVVDEAYGDFSGEDSWVSQVDQFNNLAVLRTLSKVGAAAIRCGFLVAGKDLLNEVDKVRAPFNISSYTQIAGELFLRHYELIQNRLQEIIGERERLSSELGVLNMEVFPSRGNFLLIKSGGREWELWRFLQHGGIMVRFLSRLPVAGDALRITVGTPEENDLLINLSRKFTMEGGKDA
jgi:histidinol-phosphate aminotransferase